MDQNEIDFYIGDRIRHMRRVRRLNQTQLGDLIGLSYQQIQKYERGTSRINASTLVMLASALGEGVLSFLPSGEDDGGETRVLDAKVIDALEDLTDLVAKRRLIRSSAADIRRRC